MSSTRRQPRQGASGFTLVEVLVALGLLALLALLSWRTLDGMVRTEAKTRDTASDWLQWQTAMAQWTTDLDALRETKVVPAMYFDGLSMRMVRDHPSPPDTTRSALMVVAWAVQSDKASPSGRRWARWASPPIMGRQALEAAWQAADLWARTPVAELQAQALLLPPVSGWQLFYYRSGAWSNPLSAADPSEGDLPEGVRLTLQLPEEGSMTGQLTRDWARPVLGGGKAL